MFFTYKQNNSGGSFSGPCKYFIAEADNAEQANSIAEDNGLYFDGCIDGLDCSCCGDRWYRAYDGQDSPTIYGQSLESFLKNVKRIDPEFETIPLAIVCRLNGEKESFQ